jgi:predicted regulator of Ras-like GTPase activity (Roadblock/LC7/MglB family)
VVQTTSDPAVLSWLLDDLVGRVPTVRQAVVLSADGLLLGTSSGLTQAEAEHLSAIGSGFQSLARGASGYFRGGSVRQTVVEMDAAFLFITAAGAGACLALLAAPESDIGVIAYEMAMLVSRVGAHLSAPARAAGL